MSGTLRPIVSSIFLSYRRDDTLNEARQLYEELVRWLDANGGHGQRQTFLDVESMYPTRDYREVLNEAINTSIVFIPIIGPSWLEAQNHRRSRKIDDPSDPVRLEIEAALSADHIVVLPLLARGAKMPSAARLPQSVRALTTCQAYSLPANGDLLTQRITALLRASLNIWTATVTERDNRLYSGHITFQVSLTHATHTVIYSMSGFGDGHAFISVDGQYLDQRRGIPMSPHWSFVIQDGDSILPGNLFVETSSKGLFSRINWIGRTQLSVADYLLYDELNRRGGYATPHIGRLPLWDTRPSTITRLHREQQASRGREGPPGSHWPGTAVSKPVSAKAPRSRIPRLG